MQIPFSGYAEDCTVSGQVGLESDRLSDFLATTEEFELDGAAFTALDDGRLVEAPSATIFRQDLCLVTATGPRGRPERRLWTRQYPVRAQVGPYVVMGYLHAPPTIDPLKSRDRRPILALTSSVVQYDQGGETHHDRAEAVLLNSAKIDVIESASEADLGIVKAPEVTVPVDPRSKDLTSI